MRRVVESLNIYVFFFAFPSVPMKAYDLRLSNLNFRHVKLQNFILKYSLLLFDPLNVIICV
jgi:hypothetical protein